MFIGAQLKVAWIKIDYTQDNLMCWKLKWECRWFSRMILLLEGNYAEMNWIKRNYEVHKYLSNIVPFDSIDLHIIPPRILCAQLCSSLDTSKWGTTNIEWRCTQGVTEWSYLIFWCVILPYILLYAQPLHKEQYKSL